MQAPNDLADAVFADAVFADTVFADTVFRIGRGVHDPDGLLGSAGVGAPRRLR